MLFVLTGKVQTGKTRWLQSLIADLEAAGVACSGVLAPGIWRERTDAELADLAQAGEGEPSRFEKLGFDNVLLPGGEVVPMARRRDLAKQDGTFVAESQSAQANLSWEMSEGAIDRVNEHLAGLSLTEAGEGDSSESAHARLLIIDEVGRLELLRNGGLTAALDILDAGPNARFAHVLIVVREALLDEARARFEDRWDGLHLINADEAGRAALMNAFALPK